MTQKIVDDLIKWYEDTILIILDEKSDYQFSPYRICVQRSTQRGICDCFDTIFHYNLAGDTWIKSKTDEDLPFWYDTPDYDDSTDEIIHKLQVRIDILKQFPN